MKKTIGSEGMTIKSFLTLKILKVMRNSLILLFLSTLQLFAADSYSQSTKLSLNLQNTSIENILDEIERQSEFFFVFNYKLVDVKQQMDIEAENQSISNILTSIFSNSDVDHLVLDRQIMLSPKSYIDETRAKMQPLTITGKITDENGESLPGANIVIQGTTIGVISDLEGNYSIEVDAPDAVLEFSFVGYQTQEMPVSENRLIDITMTPELIGMEEVVVIGYGTQRKINLTGAVASVGGEELLNRPVNNVAQMIQGKMPGVWVTQNSGDPGAEGIRIRIRGEGTFSSAGSEPLVLVDGVEGSLDNLNPHNIESISVLKDAASASIYGARAANGVILVTTKQGKEGRMTFEYNGNYAIHTPTKLVELITNSAEYMELYNEARINNGYSSGLYTQAQIDSYRNATDRAQYPNHDWLDDLFNPAPTQKHNLSFSGGREGTTYNVSLGYLDQEATMRGFEYQRVNVRLNLTSQVSDRVRFGSIVAMENGKRNAPRQGSGDTFRSTMAQAPTYSPQLPDGSGRYTFKAYNFEYNNKNTIAIIENKVFRNTDNYAISAQGWVNLQILESLNWYAKGAMNVDFTNYNDFRPAVPLYNFHTGQFATYLDVGGRGLEVRDTRTVYKNFYSYLEFNKTFGAHSIFAQAGYSVEENVYQFLEGYRQIYPSDDLRELDAGSPAVQNTEGNKTEWALMSGFGRLRYNYQDRYYLEGNLRYDGTSRLNPDTRWGLFPSASAAWRISEESFLQELSWLNNLKLRGSYGKLGNQNIGLYPYQAVYALTGNYAFDDANLSSGIAQTSLANRDIKWEETTISDLGVDIGVLNGLSLTFDVYKKFTSGILRGAQVTDIVGLGAPVVNSGEMQNTGFDFNLAYQKQVRSGFLSGLFYRADLNFDHFKNEVVNFGEREISYYRIREEGEEWEAFYMLEWIGIFQSDAEIASSPTQYNDNLVPGDLKYKDQDGDGDVDNDDRVVFDGKFPNYTYSFNLTANWKGFDANLFLQGVDGVQYFVYNGGTIPFRQGTPPTTDWRDRWTPTNPSNTMPRIYWERGPTKIRRYNTWYLQDGSYLRLKNVTIGYTIPGKFTQRAGINSLRIYVSGDNLLTFTDYRIMDPERTSSGSFGNPPQNKVFAFGLDIKF